MLSLIQSNLFGYSQYMSAQLNLDFLSFIYFNIEFSMQSNSAQVIAMRSIETFVHSIKTHNLFKSIKQKEIRYIPIMVFLIRHLYVDSSV